MCGFLGVSGEAIAVDPIEKSIKREYNEFRPYSALRYRPPAPEAIPMSEQT